MERDSTEKPTFQNTGIQFNNSGRSVINQNGCIFVVNNQNNEAPKNGNGSSSLQAAEWKDDRTELKLYLKGIYKTAVLPTAKWLAAGEDKIFKDYYIDMEQCECPRENIQKPMRLEEMFDAVDEGCVPDRILIESPPGYGKTCLATKLAVDWANDVPYIKHFDLTFLILLRDLRGKTLEEELQAITENALKPNFNDTNLINQENVLLILDGFDELDESSRRNVMEVLYKVKLNKTHVVVTSRTGFFPLEKADLTGLLPQKSLQCRSEFQQKKITLLGIAKDKRQEFLQKFCPNKPTEVILDTFESWPKETITVLRSPLLLFLVSFFSDQELQQTKMFTITDIYKSLMNNIIRTSLLNNNRPIRRKFDIFDLSNKVSKKVQRTLAKFGIICLDHLFGGTYSFEVNDFTNEVYSLGLLTKRKKKDSLYSFLVEYDCFHLSILEFSIAYSLWRQYMSNWISNSIDKIDKLSQLLVKFKGTSMVYRFLTDLMDDKAVHLVRQLKNIKCPLFISELSMWRQVSTSRQSDDIAQCIADLVTSPVHLHVDDYLQTFYKSEFHANILRYAIFKDPSLKITWHFWNTEINLPTDILIPSLHVLVVLPVMKSQVIPQVQCKIMVFQFTTKYEWFFPVNVVEQCRNLFETVRVNERTIITIDKGALGDLRKPVETFVYDVLSNVIFYKVVVIIDFRSTDVVEIIHKLLVSNRIYSLKLVVNLFFAYDGYLDELLLEAIVKSQSLCKLSVTTSAHRTLVLDLHKMISAKQWEKFKIDRIQLECKVLSSATHKCEVCKHFVFNKCGRSDILNGICPSKNHKPRHYLRVNCHEPLLGSVLQCDHDET